MPSRASAGRTRSLRDASPSKPRLRTCWPGRTPAPGSARDRPWPPARCQRADRRRTGPHPPRASSSPGLAPARLTRPDPHPRAPRRRQQRAGRPSRPPGPTGYPVGRPRASLATPGTASPGNMTACLRPPRGLPDGCQPRQNHHIPYPSGHAVHPMMSVTAGTDEQDRGPASPARPPCPVPPARTRCQVPLWSVLYPPPSRGTLAAQARGARPSHKGRARAARPRQASVRPPAHARPRTRQDTGQTTACRSPPHPGKPTTQIPHKKERKPTPEKRKDRKNTMVIHPELACSRALSAII